jgi:hypothetical protein
MPEHLEIIPLDALETVTSVSSYLQAKANDWARASEPRLLKCVAEELGDEIKPLSQVAVSKLYTTVSKTVIDTYAYIVS